MLHKSHLAIGHGGRDRRDIHAICGHSLKNEDGNEEEGYGVSVLCNICHNIRKSILNKEELAQHKEF